MQFVATDLDAIDNALSQLCPKHFDDCPESFLAPRGAYTDEEREALREALSRMQIESDDD
jgi:hypothetical protein